MGGGTSIWASPDFKNDPKEIFNQRLWLLVLACAFAGCSYGFDQGNIGGALTLPSFRHAFGLDELSESDQNAREGNIAAMISAGGAFGALLAGPCSDYLGRKKSMITWGLIFTIGAALQEVPVLGVFYAGRVISGLAIGATSMLAPQYLAENSPKSVRGSLTTFYNLMIILALSLAFWTNYGVSRWSGDQTYNNTQWQLSLAIQIIPGALLFIMMFFVLDTPRALIAKGKRKQGLTNLCKLRKLEPDHPYLEQEYLEICAQVDAQLEISAGSGPKEIFIETFTIASNRRRWILATCLFLFHKFTGTDSLNYFAPEIFEMIGVKKGSTTLLTTGVYGLVKLFTTIIYVAYIIDRVGRRRPLLIGGLMQATAMLYIGLYVRFANPDSTGGTPAGGIVGIIWIYIYAFGWSFGWSVAPYVVAAEIFPSRIRSFCMSWCFFVNWAVDFAITKATPKLFAKIGYGTFLIFAVLTYIGAVFVYFCMPELKGRSIESMDDLFQRRLVSMFKHAYPTEEEKVRHDVHDMLAARAVADEHDLEKAPHLVSSHKEVAT